MGGLELVKEFPSWPGSAFSHFLQALALRKAPSFDGFGKRPVMAILGLGMRRAISLSLLLVFSWMLIAPLVAQDSEANLPACCRSHCKHHCNMRRMMRLGDQKSFSTVSEKCPCLPASTCAVHSASFVPGTGTRFFAVVVSGPVSAAQAETAYRISLFRSHQKRGPPAPLA
jgi:hypothetical protein